MPEELELDLSNKRIRILYTELCHKFVSTNRISERALNMYFEADKTPQKKHINWMCKQYLQDSSRSEHIKDLVEAYQDCLIRNKTSITDIHLFKTYQDLEKEILRIDKEDIKSQIDKVVAAEVEVIYEDEEMLVFMPKNHAAAKKWSQDVKWCITGASMAWFSYYDNGNVFYFFLIKKTKTRWCVQVDANGERRLWDAEDHSHSIDEFEQLTGCKVLFESLPDDKKGQI